MLRPPLSPSSALKPLCESHCCHCHLSLSLSCHPSSPQSLMFKPTPSDFHSKRLSNHILTSHCPLWECNTSQFKALKLTARSLPTLPSHSSEICLAYPKILQLEQASHSNTEKKLMCTRILEYLILEGPLMHAKEYRVFQGSHYLFPLTFPLSCFLGQN